jgi:SRSO17 transposase
MLNRSPLASDKTACPYNASLAGPLWDDATLRQELTRQVTQQLGHAGGVLVFGPSGFPQSGSEWVGVARQWCGRLGKVDNCQVVVYLGDVSGQGHTLIDMRLYLLTAWTQGKARLDKASVPAARRGYRSRHQLALDMLQEHGARLPHARIAGDDEMGRPYGFRRRRDRLGERSLLAAAFPGHWAYATTISDVIMGSMTILLRLF